MSILYRSGRYPEFKNKLHHTAFQGQLNKVRTHLNEYCVYQRNSHNETALMHSVSNGKVEVFTELWEIYESDITYVRRQIKSGAELNHPIFIGFGADNIDEIEKLFQQYSNKKDVVECDGDDVLVLLKRDNFSKSKVIKLRVNKDNFSNVIQIIGVCFDNGVLDLNARNDLGDSIVDIATYNGLTDIALMLIGYGVNIDMNRLQWGAVKHGKPEAICHLIKKQEDLQFDISNRVNIDELIQNGSWDGVQYLLDRTDVSVNELKTASGLSLFHAAILNSQENLAEKLWDLKPNYRQCSPEGSLPIHDAIKKKFKKLVDQMLNVDHDLIVAKDRTGHNCLHHMATANWLNELGDIFEKHDELKEEFFKNLDIGVNVLCGLFGWRQPVAELIINNTIKIVSDDTFYAIFNVVVSSSCTNILLTLLKSRQVEFNKCCKSPIINALKNHQKDVAKILIDYVDDDNLNMHFDDDHNNLLKYSIYVHRGTRYICGTRLDPYDFPESPDQFAAIDENTSNNGMDYFLDRLIEKGVDYHNVNTSGQNLLHIATDGCNIYAMKKLLQLGVDENHRDNLGFPPIYYAKNILSIKLFKIKTYADLPTYLYAERPKLLEYILKNGADVNARNEENQTALYFVRRLDACKILLKYKTNVNNIDVHGITAVHALFSRRKYKIGMYVLETSDADFTILDGKGNSYLKYFLIPKDYPTLYELPKFMVMLKKHCNDIDDLGIPYLHTAIEKNITLAKILLGQEDVQVSTRNARTGDTALHCAVCFNRIDMTNEMLARGIDVNSRNNLNQTPLHVAAKKCNLKCIDILIDQNANVDVVDNNGQTPIHEAARHEVNFTRFCRLMAKSNNHNAVNKRKQKPSDLLPNSLQNISYFISSIIP